MASAGPLLPRLQSLVTFARKAINVINSQSNARAIIVCQTLPIWPFVMTDNAQELKCLDKLLDIPVLMISPIDADVLLKLINNTNGIELCSKAIIKCSYEVLTECCVCQCEMLPGENVVKLPCDHVYHSECVLTWLQRGQNTCPVCRHKLPSQQDAVKSRNQLGTDQMDV